MPPAYSDAWFCPRDNGQLLATGIDMRGRKQYRYHPDYRTSRGCLKYDALGAFGQALPPIRRRVAGDLAYRKITRDRALGGGVRLRELRGLDLPRATNWLSKYTRVLMAILNASPKAKKLLAA